MRPVTRAASHSRTYRSLSPARAAISVEVAAGSELMTSNSPARWPTDIMRHNAPWLRAVSIVPANRSAFAGSNAEDGFFGGIMATSGSFLVSSGPERSWRLPVAASISRAILRAALEIVRSDHSGHREVRRGRVWPRRQPLRRGKAGPISPGCWRRGV